MTQGITVAVEGLSEFRRGLRSLRDGAQRELTKVIKKAVQEAEGHARREYAARYGSGARGIRRIKARATQTSGGVAFNTGSLYRGRSAEKVPFGKEFGSNEVTQFNPWSGPAPGGVGSQGHFLYPAVRAQAEPVAQMLERELEALARRTAYPGP